MVDAAGDRAAPDDFAGVTFVTAARDALGDVAARADALIAHNTIGRIAGPLDAFARCRVVVRAGVGIDSIDLAGWAARGVPVCNVPDYGTDEVADHAIALMLALARGTALYHDALRHDGTWAYDAAPLVRRLRGAVFGAVGFGRIGRAASLRAASFGMRVLFHDRHDRTDAARGFERAANLADLLARADIVSLHLPLTEATRGLIDAAALRHARPGMILVNTARGGLVDLDALAACLREGRIGGAALDVLPTEPPDPAHPLIEAWRAGEGWLRGRFTLSPHAAFYSPDSQRDVRRMAVETALDYLRHGRLRNCVNTAGLNACLDPGRPSVTRRPGRGSAAG